MTQVQEKPGKKVWLDAMVDCLKEFAESSLGCENFEIKGVTEAMPSGAGAYIAMISLDASLQIGIVSTREGCRLMSGMLLGMEQEETKDLSNADVSDTVGEIINILAGMVKRELDQYDPRINLGLPIFIEGQIEPTAQQEAGAVKVTFGTVDAEVIVIRQAA